MVTRLSPALLARAVAGGGGALPGRLAADLAGLAITVLQVGQFVPQHLEMRADRSTAGLSPWLLFFGSMYTYLAFLDVALTDARSVLTCGAGAYRCFISAQPILQMLLSAALSSALWFWYLKFHKAASPAMDESHIARSSLAHAFYDMLPPRLFFQLNIAAAAAVSALACVQVATGDAARIEAFAHGCGFLAALLNAVMWMPQIIVTAAYGHKGALSIHWVIASVVMDVVYSVYLAALGFDMSVWLNNVPDALQTSVLLGIILYVERRDAENGTDDFGRRLSMMQRQREEEDRRGETLALLGNNLFSSSTIPDAGYEPGDSCDVIPEIAEV